MGQKAFETFLNRHSRLAIDSMVFIYHMESHPDFLPLTRLIFHRVEDGRHQAVTSTLSLTEVLTHPYRRNEVALARRYRGLLTEFPHLSLIPLDALISDLAASVRARYDIRTPDAIQIATALRSGATAFLTNDKQLRSIQELDIALLSTYL